MNPHLFKQRLREDNLVMQDDFISTTNCAKLLTELADYSWMPSETAALAEDSRYGQASEPARSSMTVTAGKWTPNVESILQRIESGLEKKFGIFPERLEEWQVTRYAKGERFDFHLDCGCWAEDAAGERKRTILIYLDRPLKGGSTFFRALNLDIQAIPGRIVVWNNLLANGNCNHAMVHAGLPVMQGMKTILTTWERQRKYFRNQ